MLLEYDKTKWEEIRSVPVNTLQLFVTNRCNMRCPGCFYEHRLGKNAMSFNQYEAIIEKYFNRVEKIIILGGEPTLHPDLPKMIELNNKRGLRTTIYTNACKLHILRETDLSRVSIRVDLKNYETGEIPAACAEFPVILAVMLRMSNKHLLLPFADRIESLGFEKMFISSIRDIHKTGDYWKDTEDTIPLLEYASYVNDFIRQYEGRMEIHISRRGILFTDMNEPRTDEPTHCRFGNVFPNGDKIICPFDISKNLLCKKLVFGKRPCTKNDRCLLQKIVLRRKD
jgi:hypothetical protein